MARKRLRLLYLILAIGLVWFFGTRGLRSCHPVSPVNREQRVLEHKETVADFVRFQATPTVYPKEQRVEFKIVLESTQNQGILNTDPMDMFLLTDQAGEEFPPSEFLSTGKEQYLKKGVLSFKFDASKTKSIGLVFLNVADEKLTWDIAH